LRPRFSKRITMPATLIRTRDRLGHWWPRGAAPSGVRATPPDDPPRRTALLVVCCFLLAVPALAASREYRADRFDVAITVLPGGDLEISETTTFDFQTGTFEKVWREIPGHRTDGIDIIDATMDDVRFATGNGPGHIVMSGTRRTRVEWRFTPVGPSTHTFGLKYRVRGVAYTDERGDVIAWRALPTDHSYWIASSHVTLETPDAPVKTPVVERRRVGTATIAVDDRIIDVRASQISRNGWIEIETVLPAARLVSRQPAWRATEVNTAALGPRWMMAAGAIAAVGVLFVLAVRRKYDSPSIVAIESTTIALPEKLAPALAGALINNGRAHVGHALATIVDLADRGLLMVRELPRQLGVRSYELAQVPGKHELTEHEEAALMTAFAGRGDEVTLSRARGRLTRGSRRFSAAVERDLAAEGLLDPARKAVRDRLLAVGVTFLLGGAALAIPIALLVDRFGPWPFLLSLGSAIAGLAGIIASATTTALSNEGLVRAARWRGFKRHLKKALGEHTSIGAAAFTSRDLSYAIALGLAMQSSRYLKRHPGIVPPWFAAAGDPHHGTTAFAAFVGSNASAGGAHGGGSGAAAGGGSSGAG
jgi:hypothetical protein